jgi:hypothetical protein
MRLEVFDFFLYVGNVHVGYSDDNSPFDNRHWRTCLEGGVKNVNSLN